MKKNCILNRIFAFTAICFLALSCAGLVSCSMKIDPVEPETVQGTAEQILDIIGDRVVGNFDIIVTEEMDNSTLSSLASQLRTWESSSSRKIDIHSIDLSRATGVTAIPSSAFYDLEKLESVKLPNTITTISYSAFENTGIKSITIPASVTNLNTSAFTGCSSLEAVNVEETNVNYKSVDGCVYSKNGNTFFIYPEGKQDSSYSILLGTQYISGSFYNLKKLNSLTIPASVTNIYASISGCDNLAFYVDSANENYCSDQGALYKKDPKELMAWPTASGDIVLNGVSIIRSNSFAGNKHITSVRIISPDGGTEIQYNAFNGCKILSSVDLGGTTEIGSSAFRNTNLSSITIPTSIEDIGGWAFANCNNLSNVNLGSVETIGEYCFYKCDLRNVTIPASTETIGYYAFYNNQNLSSVTFADTAVWHATTSSSYTGGDEITVTNSSQNADKLSNGDWYNKYLYKTASSSGGSGGGGDSVTVSITPGTYTLTSVTYDGASVSEDDWGTYVSDSDQTITVTATSITWGTLVCDDQSEIDDFESAFEFDDNANTLSNEDGDMILVFTKQN